MNLIWKKKLYSGVQKYATLLLINPVTKLLRACGCCPCGGRWYLVNLCTADNPCNGVDPTCVGIAVHPASNPGETLWTVPIYSTWSCKHALMVSFGGTEYNPIHLGVIKHQVSPAPFDCSVRAEIYISGTHLVDSDWVAAGTFEAGEQPFVGTIEDTGGDYVHALGTLHAFTAPGNYSVVVKVFYDPLEGDETNETVSYEAGASIICEDPGIPYFTSVSPLGTPAPGDIYILPEYLVKLETSPLPWIHRNNNPESGSMNPFALQGYQLRGPYDTYDDAKFVADHWEDTLTHWANKCVCTGGTGCSKSAIHTGGAGEGSFECPDFPGDNASLPIANTSDYWIIFSGGAQIEGGAKLEYRQYVNDVYVGNFAEWTATTGGIELWIPPDDCVSYQLWYVGSPQEGALAVIGGEICASGENIGSCEKDWDEDIDQVIPNTSDGLRAWEESQQAQNQLLSELPERMA